MWYLEKQMRIRNLVRGMLLGDQGPDVMHNVHDTRTNMNIPSALITMERLYGIVDMPRIRFATRRISQVVADVQETLRWKNTWETLDLFFRNSETRITAGILFQRMFLQKFRKQNPNTMPHCYTLSQKNGRHPGSGSTDPVTMPWYGLAQQPTLQWISVGTGTDRSLYSKEELKAAIKAVNIKPNEPEAIRFLIPCGENWASWDAALFIGKHRKNGVDIHIVFLQLTLDPNHKILAKGLNQVRDAIPKKKNGVWIHYHYVLVWLTYDNDITRLKVPAWRQVLTNSKDGKKDGSWNNLKEYVMFVSRTDLVKVSQED